MFRRRLAKRYVAGLRPGDTINGRVIKANNWYPPIAAWCVLFEPGGPLDGALYPLNAKARP